MNRKMGTDVNPAGCSETYGTDKRDTCGGEQAGIKKGTFRVIYPVPQILQKPELPNGCEITSCCQLIHFLGYPADKCDLADHYLPRSEFWYGTDPDQAYMGDPHLDEEGNPRTGYYCFAGPIATAADRYFADHHIPYRAEDITGASYEQLLGHLKEGRPFIFWASLHFDDIKYDSCGCYSLPEGRTHRVFHELHCMVCKGCDETFFYIADPLAYNEKVPHAQFMKIFRQLGSRAVVFLSCQQDEIHGTL